jgi:hypothetical protein
MPNVFAYMVLLVFPVIAVFMFKRLPIAKALVWTYLGGYLLLPAGLVINLPSLPDLDKTTIASLGAALGVWLSRRSSRHRRVAPSLGVVAESSASSSEPQRLKSLDGLIWLVVIGAILTVLANSDTLVFGPRVLRGLTWYDSVSMMAGSLLAILPFLLARNIVVTKEARLIFLRSLAVAGFLYSFLVLWEIRMSPMLQYDLYGFFPSNWSQSMRSGGYRAVVFLGHGLAVALFLSMACIAAALMAERAESAERGKWTALMWWLLVVLVLQKSFGALLITVSTLLIVRANSLTLRKFWILGIVVVTVGYPTLRSAGLLPVDKIAELASAYDPSRARSFLVRIENEDRLMKLVEQRPILGWGGWGRARIYAPDGKDVTITDGQWIITITQGGWVGYIAVFGLLTLPLYLTAKRVKSFDEHQTLMGIGLVLSANLIDLIPNAGLSPLTWLMAGVLAGALERTIVRRRRIGGARTGSLLAT